MKITRLFAALLLTAAAHAQDARKVAFRTLCMEPLPELAELWLPPAKPKGPPVAIPVFAASLSQPVEAEFKGDEVVFYVKAADKFAPAARGKLAKSKQQLLLLLPSKNEQGAPAYEIRAFDDDLASFKLGSIRAINLSPRPIRFTFAGQLSPPVPPAGSALYPKTAKADEYGMYVVSAEVQGEGEKWTKMYSANWKSSDGRREIAIVQFDEKFKLASIKLINDDPPWVNQK